MATVARSTTYPNVLLVTGDDVVTGDYRANLRRVLEDASPPGPVSRGTHDFWMTFQIGSAANPNHSWMDQATTPRMRRGIIEMASPPDASDVATLRPRLGTLIHEFGHGWLVPRDLTVRAPEYWPAPDRTAPGMDGYDSTIAFTEGSRYWGPAFVARQGSHWNCWVHSGGSCMDGIPWRRAGNGDGLHRWDPVAVTTPTLTPDGLPGMTLPAVFGDADLFLMGILRRDEAFGAEGNRMYWMEPRLMAPLEFHAGLVLLFGFNDAYYFGFYTDHRTIGVQRSGRDLTTIAAPDSRPFPATDRAVALRIIRRGTTYVFQARYANLSGELTARHLGGAGSWPAPSGGPLTSEWTTVAQHVATERPQAIGMGVKTWRPILCEAHFEHLEIGSGGIEQAYTTNAELPVWRPSETSGLSSLPPRLVRYLPTPGPRVRRARIAATVSTPWLDFDAEGRYTAYDSFDDWTASNRAPKLLAAAPSGDFVMATTARVDRSGLSPWAGGAALEKAMWGVERSVPMSDLVVPDWLRVWQAAPAGNAYKSAFIIVARNASDIRPAHEQAVDTLRRYFDAAMPPLTRNRRTSDSTI